MMKKANTLLCLLLLSVAAMAQSRYCLTPADYVAGQWTPLDSLRLEYRSNSKSVWLGGASYKPLSGDKKIDKLLKKRARFIQQQDTLYINCRQLTCGGIGFGNWYAPACPFERDYVLFVARSVRAQQQGNMATFMFGVAGVLVAVPMQKHAFSCYVFNPGTETVELVDKAMMERLLEGRPDLQEALEQTDAKHRYQPQTLLPILQQLGVIDRLPISAGDRR